MSEKTILPDAQELNAKLAEIIARVCNCDYEPLLADQDFSAVITQFDSLAVLEIMLEIETAYGIDTDEMLPVSQDTGAQDLLSIFPQNISGLAAYLHEVVARRPQREAEWNERVRRMQGTDTREEGSIAEAAPSMGQDEVAEPPHAIEQQGSKS